MRFNLKLEMEGNEIPVDYRSLVLSFIKDAMEEHNIDWYRKNYAPEKGKKTPVKKPFTFAVYLRNPKFDGERIILDSNEIRVNFSTYDSEYAINFFNSILKQVHKQYWYKDIRLKLTAINLLKEEAICNRRAVFKTLSPIVVRKHDKESNKDKNLCWDEEGFAEQMKINIYESAKDFFDFDIERDVKEMKIEPVRMKKVLVAHFNEKAKMRIEGNIGEIEIEGKEYLLEWIYKAGAGSRRGQGFGMCEIV